ncbi:hypothetical protein ACJ4V0_01170 [Phreatobacter sp. HK31-P]
MTSPARALAKCCFVRRRSSPGVVAALLVLLSAGIPAGAQELSPVTVEDPDGQRLVERLRRGGLVLFFRHADTAGMPCDVSFRLGDRAGQRNISARGREQSRRIGEAFVRLAIPVQRPVLAGPVYRARDTAEEAFGVADVAVVDGLTADDFAGARLAWVLDEHRRLMAEPVPSGSNRILVGHRTPAIMLFGGPVGGRAFPEGAAIVMEPARAPRILGILMLAPIPGAGFHGC